MALLLLFGAAFSAMEQLLRRTEERLASEPPRRNSMQVPRLEETLTLTLTLTLTPTPTLALRLTLTLALTLTLTLTRCLGCRRWRRRRGWAR